MQIPSSSVAPHVTSPAILAVYERLIRNIPQTSSVVSEGVFVTHRCDTDEGRVDTKTTVEYAPIFNLETSKLVSFVEVTTTTVDKRVMKVLKVEDLLGRTNINTASTAASTNGHPGDDSANSQYTDDTSSNRDSCADGKPGTDINDESSSNVDDEFGIDLDRESSIDFDSESSIDFYGEPSSDSGRETCSDADGECSNDADCEDNGVANDEHHGDSDTSSVICECFGAHEASCEVEHRRFRAFFQKESNRMQATAQPAPSSPAPSLSSLTYPPSPSSPLRFQPENTETPTRRNYEALASTLQSPISLRTSQRAPLQALISSESSPINASDIFTPNTNKVWDDIDQGLDAGFSSPYHGPSTPRAKTSTRSVGFAISSTCAGPAKKYNLTPWVARQGSSVITHATQPDTPTHHLAASKRRVISLSDSEDLEEVASGVENQSPIKKQKV